MTCQVTQRNVQGTRGRAGIWHFCRCPQLKFSCSLLSSPERAIDGLNECACGE